MAVERGSALESSSRNLITTASTSSTRAKCKEQGPGLALCVLRDDENSRQNSPSSALKAVPAKCAKVPATRLPARRAPPASTNELSRKDRHNGLRGRKGACTSLFGISPLHDMTFYNIGTVTLLHWKFPRRSHVGRANVQSSCRTEHPRPFTHGARFLRASPPSLDMSFAWPQEPCGR